MRKKRVIKQRLERSPASPQSNPKGQPSSAVKRLDNRPLKAFRPKPSGTPSSLLRTPPQMLLVANEYPTPPWFRKDEAVEVTIIIPLYKSDKVVVDLIATWPDDEGINYEILFIDDQCPNDSKSSVLKAWLKYRNGAKAGRILLNPENQGYGQTCNAAARLAKGEFLVFLNADTRLTQGWLKPIIDALKQDKVGIVGNLQLKEGGVFDGTIDGAGSEWRWDRNEFYHIGRHSFHHQDLVQPMKPATAPAEIMTAGERDMVTGCCFGISNRIFRYIGGFDPNYRIGYWEDSEINMRVKELGYKVLFEPKSVIYHKLSHSNAAGHPFMNTNQQYFMNKWYTTGRIDRIVSTKRPTVRPDVKSILLKRSGANGDVLVAASVAAALKKMHNNCSIVFSTSCPGVLKNNPYINNIISDHEISDRLANVYFDLDLCYELRPECNIIKAYADQVGVSASDCEFFMYDSPVPQNIPENYIVVHAGRTNWEGRNWTEKKWVEVVENLQNKRENVVIIGRENDWTAPGCVDLRGKTDMWQLAGVVKKARLFVGVDSFPMHLAQTYQTPGVVFFGSVRPELRIYRRNMKPVTAVHLDCLGCHHRKPRPCTFTGDCETGTKDCINNVSVEDMMRQIAAIAPT